MRCGIRRSASSIVTVVSSRERSINYSPPIPSLARRRLASFTDWRRRYSFQRRRAGSRLLQARMAQRHVWAARARGEETGLTGEEIAFYGALAQNESARQVMGEPALRVIVSELVASREIRPSNVVRKSPSAF